MPLNENDGTRMSATHRHLPQVNEVAVEEKFITAAEHEMLLLWAEERFSGGHLKANPAGPSRYYNQYEKGDSVPDIFWEIRHRAVSRFSVTDYEDEPKYRCFLGCNTEGGFVRRHTDPSPLEKHHIRMNIMLSKPISGGYPIVNDKMIQVEERDLWCFYPELMPHESTPVLGSRNRFVLSIGILVPRTSAY